LLLIAFQEGEHRSEADGIVNILNRIPLTAGEFGQPEANALVARLKQCQGTARDADSSRDFVYALNAIPALINGSDDYLGTKKVDQRRADAERQRIERSAAEAAERQAREQAKEEARLVRSDIATLATLTDLSAAYREIESVRGRIQQLPADLRSDLLDALQVAVMPIDRHRSDALADLQHALLEIEKLPDGEDKLRRLGEIMPKIKAIPGPKADELAGDVETIRDATRLKMNESANATGAGTAAEGDDLKAAVEEQRSKVRAAEEAAAARQSEREQAAADAKASEEQLLVLVSVYSVARVCAANNIIYDDAKIDILKRRITGFIQERGIQRSDVDRIWKAAQEGTSTATVRENDCTALGSYITRTFGQNVFDETLEKNPF
jgi:hypothetical protein